MDIREMWCENLRGEILSFNYHTSPYFVEKIEGIGTTKNIIHTVKSANQNGESVTGIVGDKGNIVLDVLIMDNIIQNYERLSAFFGLKQSGIFHYKRGNEINKKCKYEVETCELAEEGILKRVVLSLIIPQGFWEEEQEETHALSEIQGLIEFPLEMPVEPIELTIKTTNLFAKWNNDTNIETGLIITMLANAEVENPGLFDVINREFFTIDTTMRAGERIVINTKEREKQILSYYQGIEEDITDRFAYGSKWLTNKAGDNVFRYTADEGLEFLELTISFNKLSGGVV